MLFDLFLFFLGSRIKPSDASKVAALVPY